MTLLLLAAALAHHDANVARVAVEAPPPATGSEEGSDLPRLSLGIGVDAISFSTQHRGRSRMPAPYPVAALTTTASATLSLRTGTSLAVTAPIVGVFRSKKVLAGVGDPLLVAGQGTEWGSTRLSVQVGASAPLGATGSESAVPVLDLVGADGALDVTATDTRARPGLGAWAVIASALASTAVERWGVSVSLAARVPAHTTQDEILWGTDLFPTLSLTRTFGVDRVSAGVALEGWAHTRDRFFRASDGAGEPIAVRANRRLGLAVAPSLSIRTGARSRCAASASVPLAQHVEGTQLTHVARVSGTCSVAVRLSGRPQPTPTTVESERDSAF